MGDMLRRGSKVQTFTPVVTAASAYAANNIVGTLFEIPGASLDSGAATKLSSVTSLSASKADPALTLVLFSQKPSGTYTDKTAFAPSTADLAFIVGVAALGATWKDFSANSASSDKDLNLLLQVQGSDPLNPGPGKRTSLWGILVATGTPTFGTASDLTVKISFEQF